jgi:hypothetical protein
MKRIMYLLTVLMLAAILASTGCSRKPEPSAPPVDEEPQAPDTAVLQKADPINAIINNHSAARPQSGLQQASFIYEFLAEGGITRYLAVYDTPYPQDYIVGPVRSLRPYFAVQAAEHGGIVANSGYSSRTREEIRGLGIRDIQSSQYLYRDSSRKAPHNLYTSTDKLYAARGDSEVQSITASLLPPTAPSEEGLEIEVTYGNSYKVTYTYSETDQAYLRSINDKPHTDRETNKQYSAHRVIIRPNKHTPVPGTTLLDVDLEGSGTATLYEYGRKFDIRWEKTDGKTNYFFQDNTPVSLDYSNTWIQVTKL